MKEWRWEKRGGELRKMARSGLPERKASISRHLEDGGTRGWESGLVLSLKDVRGLIIFSQKLTKPLPASQ